MARMISKSEVWSPSERSGLTPIGDSIEKLLSVPLNPHDHQEGFFDLYYFVHTPLDGRGSKTVLFCSGGPGEIVRTADRANTYVDFLFSNGYNVVYFHLRGSGISQIASSNEYDKFLKGTYAVEDIEAIRRDLGEDGKGKDVAWDAIIGWSYGTVLAQLYAHRYPTNCQRLILISPLSRHMFNQSVNGFNEYYNDALSIYRETLRRIYHSDALQNEFGDLTNDDEHRIITELFGTSDKKSDGGILKKTEEAFGSIQFVVGAYAALTETDFERFEVRKYSQKFYQKLLSLRIYGANAVAPDLDEQRSIGKVFRQELIDGRRLENEKPVTDSSQGSQRAYLAFGVQDGINWRFLNVRSVPDKGDLGNALMAIGGKAHVHAGAHTWLEKLRIDEHQMIKAWDPAKYRHNVPTLVLVGEADAVTAAGQAEYIFSKALTGPRTLISFPTVAHAMLLGNPIEEETRSVAGPPQMSGAIRTESHWIPPGAIRAVTGNATGQALNSKLGFKLKAPEALAHRVRVHGCSLLTDGNLHAKGNGKENILALIKNTSTQTVKIKGTKWRKSNAFFWGTVQFIWPNHIKPGKIELAYGSLIEGGKKKEWQLDVQPKQKLERGLKKVGFNVDPSNARVNLWIQNKGKKTVDGATRDWTISNQKMSLLFKVDIPPLKPQEITLVSSGVDGLKIDPNEVLNVTPPSGLRDSLEACLDPQEDKPNRIRLILWHTARHARDITVKRANWTLACPAFSVSVSVDPVTIPAGSVRTSYATITGITWHRWLDIRRPSDLEPEIELIGFNVLEDDKVKLLLKSTSNRALKAAARDWVYVDLNQDFRLANLDSNLNCLIYSFLTFSPTYFHRATDNKILQTIERKFRKVSLSFTLKHLGGN